MAPTLLPIEKPPPSEDVKVAIIGGGTQGRVLIEQALKIKGLKFKAACDIWPYAQKYATGLIKTQDANHTPPAIYTDYQEMLAKEKDLQAVIVATPDWMHAEHSIACLKAGLHVYCESPMSNDEAQAREMVLAARKAGRLLQIGQQRRSDPRYLFCRENFLTDERVLDRITVAYGHWSGGQVYSGGCGPGNWVALVPRGFPKNLALDEATLKKHGYGTMDRFRDWQWLKKFGSGPLGLLGLHQIDVFNWFLGARPKSVTAAGGLDFLTGHGWEWPDNVAAIYEYETPRGPVRAAYRLNWTDVEGTHFECFMGIDGTFDVSDLDSHFRFAPQAHATPFPGEAEPEWVHLLTQRVLKESRTWSQRRLSTPLAMQRAPDPSLKAEPLEPFPLLVCAPPSDPPEDPYLYLHYEPRPSNVESGLTAHLRNFIDAVRGNAKLACPGEVGYATAVQVLKTYEAITTGKRVTFKEEDFKA